MIRPALAELNLHRFDEARRNRADHLRLWRWTTALGSVQMAALYLHRISFGVR